MGFFDSVEQATTSFNELHPKEALALAGLMMIMVDGELEAEEFHSLSMHAAVNEKTRKRAWDMLKREPSQEKHIEMVAGAISTVEQRLACLTVLLDIAMVDGNIASSEKALFEKYLEAFEVDHEPVKEIKVEQIGRNEWKKFLTVGVTPDTNRGERCH